MHMLHMHIIISIIMAAKCFMVVLLSSGVLHLDVVIINGAGPFVKTSKEMFTIEKAKMCAKRKFPGQIGRGIQ